ncbi:MAG: hypothetical protein WBZ33_15380, partial [Thermoactinomyces sp.]
AAIFQNTRPVRLRPANRRRTLRRLTSIRKITRSSPALTDPKATPYLLFQRTADILTANNPYFRLDVGK